MGSEYGGNFWEWGFHLMQIFGLLGYCSSICHEVFNLARYFVTEEMEIKKFFDFCFRNRRNFFPIF